MDDDTLGSEAAGASSHAPLCGDDEREAIQAEGLDPDDPAVQKGLDPCALGAGATRRAKTRPLVGEPTKGDWHLMGRWRA